VTWGAWYTIIAVTIALISLLCTKPEKISPLWFVLAHAFWPASLIAIALAAMWSSDRYESKE
jgi:hypothetical protein